MSARDVDLFGNPYGVPAGHELAVCEQPLERARAYGLAALSDVEALALVLQGEGTRAAAPAVMSARMLVNHWGSVARLAGVPAVELVEVGGISEAQAFRVCAAVEVGRRIACGPLAEQPLLNGAAVVAQFMAAKVAGLEVEKFWVLCLNRKNRLLRCVEITSGTATAALAHPREVYRAAVRESATAIICVHNHPSGDPAPSSADVQVTRLLRESAKALDIELLDHVIVGRAGADPLAKGHFSFREAGIL